MFISMNWISDFVDLSGLDKMDLIAKFSLSTAEVENDIFHKGEDLSGVVVAEIKSVEEHPESKKLHLLKVDAGDGKLTDVVCGAPNVRVGMKTAFAKVGAQIGDITIAPRPLAGFDSFGMCCSEKEIGISDNNDGIMDILEDVANGTDIKDLYEIDDIIFEVDNKSLTNRPDLWGHYGIAREFATIAKRPLKELPTIDLSQYDNLEKIDLKIEDELCQRYSSIKVENVEKNVAPMNMRIRLYYCGMRGINLLTDLTNYLMLEMGQPMHAFDSRKVGKIRIKRFDKPFTFTTLDGVERNIDENTLMICNDNTPVAIAGIMGGLDSEIVDDTTTLTLESATFNAASIRKSAVRLAHRTDASARYEKSLDPEMTTVAIARFMKLLLEIDPGVKVVSALTDEYAFHYPKVALDFDKAFVDKYTGIQITNEHIVDTLTALGFGVTQDGDNFHVDVPSYRATKDISLKADIIEEITRIYGYDNFELSTTTAPLYPVRMAEDKNVEDRIKDILVKRFRIHEVHSYVWQYADEYKKLGMEVEDNIKLANSTNPNIETLRNSIIPTQLCQVNYNTGYATDFGIFEVGHVVEGIKADGLCDEKKKLCITLFSKTKSLETLYLELRDMIAEVVDDIRHKPLTYKKLEAKHSYEHPKNLNAIVLDETVIGKLGVAHPLVSKKIDKKASIVFAEIDIESLANIVAEPIKYVEPSKYPSIEVDLSFVAEKFSEINDTIKESAESILRKVGVADIYNDGNSKSITVRLLFGDDERTLTHEEVQTVVDKIIEKLKTKGINLKA
ncbi:phenylalanyl-tRNA synthetase beta subunit [Pseudobutyrivibrio sp. NOR37]|uniref:Phenylalanine--tRNA ligase beta subunit n=2 Tax=Pseudobutyrivibrio TaxID=46205 RepID=A0A6M0LEE3_PSEXY|nr:MULTISPECIES: phenylalanine--tRNA ligase subunit beta [Pseudobutyrivibrio]NEX00816.1 phenylalanine--tRNA ligase subunit beta [Pseudobutyrivibrio xylanivorans]SFR62898.1 phenylalanyl-tRNA synthetase beta subunit [Pseudobutyrivibrio sp. NOR37]